MATSTPWGASQYSESLCRGIVSYGTAGHGGVHLSPTRNCVVPEYMRNANGWYEEDCEWAIPAAIFPEAWVKHYGTEDILATIKSTLLNYYPDFYAKFYNVEIKEGESYENDARNFKKNNKDNYVVICATGKDNHVEVIATKGGEREDDSEERTFLIKTEEYQNRGKHGFVIDLDRHIEI